MQIAINVLCLALAAAGVYGLTRDKSIAWGKWLAGVSFAIILIFQISGPPPDGCVRYSSFAESC